MDFSLNPLETDRDGFKVPSIASKPLLAAEQAEPMSKYFARLKAKIDESKFEVVRSIESDGLYIGKREIQGAEGQAKMLNEAGTVFYHVLLYVRKDGKTTSLEYGPQGSADMTSNIMEAVPCSPVLTEQATPDAGYPLLKIKTDHLDADDPLVKQAILFVQSRKYHAVYNNCIKTTDFLCRIMTRGEVRNGPLIYDALAGKLNPQDHPMLLMFFLMTRISWFDICDGSKLTGEFITLQSGDPDFEPRNSLDLPRGLISAAADARATQPVDLQAVLKNIAGEENDLSEPAMQF